MDDQFRVFLLDWLERRGWSRARLSEAADISQSLISKYLADDPRKRVTPRPSSLEKLASVLDVEYADLLRMCGYLPGEVSADDQPDEVEHDVRARIAEYTAAVRDTPEWAWTTIIKSTFDRAIADVQEAGRLLEQAASDNKVPPASATRRRNERRISGSERRQRPIKPRYQAMAYAT